MSKIYERLTRQNVNVISEAGLDITLADSIEELKSLLGIDNVDNIAGKPISIDSLSDKDVLRYTTSTNEWKNVNQTVITDGGNF